MSATTRAARRVGAPKYARAAMVWQLLGLVADSVTDILFAMAHTKGLQRWARYCGVAPLCRGWHLGPQAQSQNEANCKPGGRSPINRGCTNRPGGCTPHHQDCQPPSWRPAVLTVPPALDLAPTWPSPPRPSVCHLPFAHSPSPCRPHAHMPTS